MKSRKNTTKIKAFAVSIAVCLAFVLCTVLSFGFLAVPNKINAGAEGDSPTGVRFAQVSAGEDFVIGLTYDGDLYGWSLLPQGECGKGDEAKTLGEYYTTVPTKISFDWIKGPEGAAPTVDNANCWENPSYHNSTQKDSIYQIATTRTTAAILSGKGYLYTWGYDIKDTTYDSIIEHYLLLREASNNSNNIKPYIPYIIDYGYTKLPDNKCTYSDKGALIETIPPSNGLSHKSLAASEYNYIYTWGTGGSLYTYTWGSLLYDVRQFAISGADKQYYASSDLQDSAHYSYVYQLPFSADPTTTKVAAIGGGYNVGLNLISSTTDASNQTANISSLLLRGRNFITSATDSGSVYNAVKVVEPSSHYTANEVDYTIGSTNILFDGKTYNNLIFGDRSADASGSQTSGSQIFKPYGSGESAIKNVDLYFGRQEYSADKLLNYDTSNSDAKLYGSDGTAYDTGTTNGVTLSAVSLGNDMGYGISGGKLYSWGDNAQGQNGFNDSATTPVRSEMDTSPGDWNSNVFTVAAGKQKSGAKRAFIDSGVSDNSFGDGVKNDADYITGIIRKGSSATELWVWSNKAQEPQQLNYAGIDSPNYYNQFIAVYSGYGNNLFAVTRLGQVVRIEYQGSGYVQTIYDKFSTGGEAFSNWEIAGENDNFVKFKVRALDGEADARVPNLGSVTISVNKAETTRSTVLINPIGTGDDETSTEYNGARKSLVTENKSGYVYRILDPAVDSGNIKVVKTTCTGVSEYASWSTVTVPQLEFYWAPDGADDKGELLDDVQRENMFSYEFTGSGQNLGIKITPKQSTKSGIVTVKFTVGRYDCLGNSTYSNNDPVFYDDFKECYVKFEVANTAAYLNFSQFNSADGNRANVPLLDPNNEYNKKYSIAIQNVSDGIESFLDTFFSGDTALKNSVYNFIKTKDAGFPDSGKIAQGNLTYYLSAADQAKYNDKYNYLYIDRDADLVRVTNEGDISPNGHAGVIANVVKIHAEQKDEILINNPISNLAELNANIKKHFNNVYGLYDLQVVERGGSYCLEFAYDVVTFTAKNSTGTLTYADNKKVNDYTTTRDGGTYSNFNLEVTEYYAYKSDYTSNTGSNKKLSGTKQSIVAVFAQPSVRLKSDGSIYGNHSGTNSKTEQISQVIYVGDTPDASKKTLIRLTDYIEVADKFIKFSFNNSTSTYADFNSQFVDVTGSGVKVVELSSTEIKINPTTAHPLNFSVTIQRFFGNENLDNFSVANAFADEDEKITLKFQFTNISSFSLNWSAPAQSISVTEEGLVDVLGATEGALNGTTKMFSVQTGVDSTDKYRSEIKMSSLSTSDPSVLTVDPITDGEKRTTFSVKPKASGRAQVQFVLSVYEKSIVCSLGFNVSTVTKLEETVELIEEESIYIDTLLNELKRANDFVPEIDKYGILYDDPEAFYIEDAEGTRKELRDTFISSITFEQKDTASPYMLVRLNYDAPDMDKTYTLYVQYVRKDKDFDSYEAAKASGATVLKTSQSIKSQKKTCAGENGDPILTIKINVDSPHGENTTTNDDYHTAGINTNMTVSIPLGYLLPKVGITNYNNYKISLVTAGTDAAQYFNYGYDTEDDAPSEVKIEPQYNTPDMDGTEDGKPVTVNVSISPKSSASEEKTFIISFRVSITGITTTLTTEEYRNIWLIAFFSSFGLLFIIFLIRFIVYWRRRAKQRALIKRNQELIKMRDRVHNRSTAATHEQIVRSRMRMEDPRYAQMVNEMRRERQGGVDSSGVMLENMDMPVVDPNGKGGKKGKKKKGGKKTIAELKAELEAKKAAFAEAQNGGMSGADMNGAMPNDFGMDGAMPNDFGMNGADPNFGSPADGFSTQDLDANAIIFDAPDDVQG